MVGKNLLSHPHMGKCDLIDRWLYYKPLYISQAFVQQKAKLEAGVFYNKSLHIISAKIQGKYAVQ